jgi:HSP90 family molecular chaperone
MAKDQDEARKAIIEAGEKLVEFCGELDKFSPRQVVWFKSEKLPDPLLNDLNKALSVSKELVERFGEDPTLNNALTLCQANRETMLLLFLYRSGYHEKENIISFRGYVERSHDYYSHLARNMTDDKVERSLMLEWAKSEQYRLYILDALLDNDMDKARGMMWEAIENAFKERHGLLFDK